MKRKKVLPHRRKREGKTHYKKRLRLLVAKRPRLVIRKSNKNIIAQFVEYYPKGDKVAVSSCSKELIKLGWNGARSNIPSAYLTGLLCGIKAKKKGISEAILDVGIQQPSVKGCAIYAALKGVLDAGIKVPHSKEVLPPDERIFGQHISDYANKLSATQEAFARQFGGYQKRKFSLENFKKAVEEVKAKILKF